MSLVEIARFSDVYEADLAAVFLESHGIPVSVTERHQTTIDPLMQRALGIRILGASSNYQAARDLLARARAGEFVEDDGDDLETAGSGTRTTGRLMALLVASAGAFWGTSLPRRLRPIHLIGLAVIGLAVVTWVTVALLWTGRQPDVTTPEASQYAHW